MSTLAPEHIQAAREVVNQYLIAGLRVPKRSLEEFVATAIQAAVEAEREACAKVCDSKEIERRLVSEGMGPRPRPGRPTDHKDCTFMMDKSGRLGGESVAAQLAAAIRSRGQR